MNLAAEKRMLYVLLMIITGCLLGMQPPINAALGRHTGMLEGGLVNFVIGTAALSLVVAIFGKGQLSRVVEAPWWQLTGGLFGALMVCAAMISVPRIGALTTMLALILGNLAVGALIDNYGWFGIPVTSFSLSRLMGFCLVLAGLFFIFRH